MTSEELRRLLRQQEGPTLDFKREWYKIDDPNADTQNRQRDELIKDVLALANGSTNTAGEVARLVIGVDESLNGEGERDICGADGLGEPLKLRKRILQMIEKACDPALEDLELEIVSLDGKGILVITIPPSPHLYETTRKLNTSKSTYNEHVVFMRRGESNGIASAKERAAISQLKRIRFNELRNAPPIPFGAAIGAIVGGLLSIALADKTFGTAPGRLTGFVIGAVLFGLIGAGIGSFYRDFVSTINMWPRLSRPVQLIIALFLVVAVVVLLISLWTSIFR
jgi:hypothetical protein